MLQGTVPNIYYSTISINLLDFNLLYVYLFRCLFDNPFSSIPLDTGEMDIESNTPTALAVSSDVASVAHGDVIVINSITYHIVGVQKDSGRGYQGTTLLMLEKQ